MCCRHIVASAELAMTRIHLKGLRARVNIAGVADEELAAEVQKAEAAVATAYVATRTLTI